MMTKQELKDMKFLSDKDRTRIIEQHVSAIGDKVISIGMSELPDYMIIYTPNRTVDIDIKRKTFVDTSSPTPIPLGAIKRK